MYVDDLTTRVFATAARGHNLGVLFGVGAALALVGLALLGPRKSRRLGLSALLASAGTAWVGLLTISEARTSIRLTEIITARQFTFVDSLREAAQLGLLAVPALGWLARVAAGRLEHNRRKALLSTYLRIATKAYFDGNFDRAIAEFSIALKVDPSRTDVLVRRGKAWVQRGDYDRAVADFDRALKVDRDHGPAYLNRGIVRANRGDHGAAIADFEVARSLSPGDAAPWLYRGISLARLGESARAADDLRRVLQVTNHTDFTEPAKFHLMMVENDLHPASTPVGP